MMTMPGCDSGRNEQYGTGLVWGSWLSIVLKNVLKLPIILGHGSLAQICLVTGDDRAGVQPFVILRIFPSLPTTRQRRMGNRLSC
jgi:hypothetical protein